MVQRGGIFLGITPSSCKIEIGFYFVSNLIQQSFGPTDRTVPAECPPLLRHRPHRPDGLLQRPLAELGDRCRRPTRIQATLLDLAREQIAHNIDLLRPGVSFVDYASRAFRLPDAYLANRYADLVHGCGLGVEYPFVLYPEDADDGMYDGHFEANVIVCVESYVGALDGPEGVKLEEPVLITENGPEVLSALPLEAVDF